MALSPAQKKLLQSTIPILRSKGEVIAQTFYNEMFAAHPELLPLFDVEAQQDGSQAKRLAGAILTYVGNIDHLDGIEKSFKKISKRHVREHVGPKHYEIVGAHLLGAIKSVLGAAATAQMLEAWKIAYSQLAEMMIARQQELRVAAVKFETTPRAC